MKKIVFYIWLATLIFFNTSTLYADNPSTQKQSNTAATTAATGSTPQDSSTHTMQAGESFSLMLSDTEQKMISSTLAGDKLSTDDATCYYLGGIVYSAPTNWTLWLNGQTYSTGSDIPGITILNVSRDSVNLKGSETKSKSGVLLRMDQTFCRDNGQALAGDQRR